MVGSPPIPLCSALSAKLLCSYKVWELHQSSRVCLVPSRGEWTPALYVGGWVWDSFEMCGDKLGIGCSGSGDNSHS